MTAHKTNTPGMSGKTRLILILVIIGLVTSLVGLVYRYGYLDTNETRNIEGSTGQMTPNPHPSPTNRPVKIVAEIPSNLTDEQRWYKEVVEMILDDPERWVGKKEVVMSDNDRQVFIVLMMTESSLYQFDENGNTLDSGIDCDGIGQVCTDLCDRDPKDDTDLRYNPFENVYCALDYFASLIKKWDGNYAMAVAEYKGAIEKRNGKTVPIPDHPVVQELFDHLALR